LFALLPAAAIEYLSDIYRSDAKRGAKMVQYLLAPLGIAYALACLVHKAIFHEKLVQVVLKSRLSDGRLRISYGVQRDALAKDSLSNFEDKRLFKVLELYQKKDEEEYIDNLSDEESALEAEIARQNRYYDGLDDGIQDDDRDGESKSAQPRGSGSSPVRAGDFYSSYKLFGAAVPSAALVYKRKPTNIGRKRGVRIAPSSPFLQLANVGSDVDHVKSALGEKSSDVKGISFRKSMLMVQKQEILDSHYNRSLGDTTKKAPAAQNPNISSLVLLQNGKISPYQPGITTIPSEPSVKVASDTSNDKKRNNLPVPASKAEDDIAASEIRQLSYPSIYFAANRFAPLYTDIERRDIFKIVLPDQFVDDFTHTVQQSESYIYILQQRICDMENKQEQQLSLLRKLLDQKSVLPAQALSDPFYEVGTTNYYQ
jgi:hypothetical protein